MINHWIRDGKQEGERKGEGRGEGRKGGERRREEGRREEKGGREEEKKVTFLLDLLRSSKLLSSHSLTWEYFLSITASSSGEFGA